MNIFLHKNHQLSSNNPRQSKEGPLSTSPIINNPETSNPATTLESTRVSLQKNQGIEASTWRMNGRETIHPLSNHLPFWMNIDWLIAALLFLKNWMNAWMILIAIKISLPLLHMMTVWLILLACLNSLRRTVKIYQHMDRWDWFTLW